MNRNLTLFLILLALAPAGLLGQQKVKFANIPLQDLQRQVFEGDTSAVAAILYDKGHLRTTDGKFHRHQRIKIFKKAGTSFGNIVLRVPSKGDFTAYVFNHENGEVVKEKLERSSVFEEEIIQGFYVYKLFLPNVKEGSVIDLRYSHFGIPFEWRFQDVIPVVHSELILDESDWIQFTKSQKGFGEITKVRENHWIAKDMPAFVKEPHVSHYSNYITKFEFQLSKYFFPGVVKYEVSDSWETIGKRLLGHYRFGGLLKTSGYLNDMADSLKSSELSVSEKISEAYAYIKENIKWDKNQTIYASQQHSKCFERDHAGNSADINLMLISLLKKADITAYPVVLSTRDNGLLNEYYPSLWRLNHVVAYVEHNGDTVLLDATDKDLTPGVLSPRSLNGQGWAIIDKEHGKWINLSPSKQSATKQLVQIKLTEDDNSTATVSQMKTNYHYLDWLAGFEAAGSEEKQARRLEEAGNVRVENYTLKKNDREKLSSSEVINVDLGDYISDLGNEIILNPYLLCGILENPFKSEGRVAPIDLHYPTKTSATISIELPEAYIVSTIPESVLMKIPDGGISFMFKCNQQGNKIRIQYQLDMTKTIYSIAQYPVLRNFYSQLINKLSESIQITKRT